MADVSNKQPISSSGVPSGSEPLVLKSDKGVLGGHQVSKYLNEKLRPKLEIANMIFGQVVGMLWQMVRFGQKMSHFEGFSASLLKIPGLATAPFMAADFIRSVWRLVHAQSHKERLQHIYRAFSSLVSLGQSASSVGSILQITNTVASAALQWMPAIGYVAIAAQGIAVGVDVYSLVKLGVLNKRLQAADASFATRLASYERAKKKWLKLHPDSKAFERFDAQFCSLKSSESNVKQLRNLSDENQKISQNKELQVANKKVIDKAFSRLSRVESATEKLNVLDRLLLFLKGLPGDQAEIVKNLRTQIENILTPYDAALCEASQFAMEHAAEFTEVVPMHSFSERIADYERKKARWPNSSIISDIEKQLSRLYNRDQYANSLHEIGDVCSQASDDLKTELPKSLFSRITKLIDYSKDPLETLDSLQRIASDLSFYSGEGAVRVKTKIQEFLSPYETALQKAATEFSYESCFSCYDNVRKQWLETHPPSEEVEKIDKVLYDLKDSTNFEAGLQNILDEYNKSLPSLGLSEGESSSLKKAFNGVSRSKSPVENLDVLQNAVRVLSNFVGSMSKSAFDLLKTIQEFLDPYQNAMKMVSEFVEDHEEEMSQSPANNEWMRDAVVLAATVLYEERGAQLADAIRVCGTVEKMIKSHGLYLGAARKVQNLGQRLDHVAYMRFAPPPPPVSVPVLVPSSKTPEDDEKRKKEEVAKIVSMETMLSKIRNIRSKNRTENEAVEKGVYSLQQSLLKKLDGADKNLETMQKALFEILKMSGSYEISLGEKKRLFDFRHYVRQQLFSIQYRQVISQFSSKIETLLPKMAGKLKKSLKEDIERLKTGTDLEKAAICIKIGCKLESAAKEGFVEKEAVLELQGIVGSLQQAKEVFEVSTNLDICYFGMRGTTIVDNMFKAIVAINDPCLPYAEKMKQVHAALIEVENVKRNIPRTINDLRKAKTAITTALKKKPPDDLSTIDFSELPQKVLDKISIELGKNWSLTKDNVQKVLEVINNAIKARTSILGRFQRTGASFASALSRVAASCSALARNEELHGVAKSVRSSATLGKYCEDPSVSGLLQILEGTATIAEKVKAANTLLETLKTQVPKDQAGKIPPDLQKVEDGVTKISQDLKYEYAQGADMVRKLAKRTRVQMGQKVASIALKIVGIVGSILLFFPPLMIAGFVLVVVGAFGSMLMKAGEAVFVNKDPFNPHSRAAACGIASAINRKLKQAGHWFSKKFKPANPGLPRLIDHVVPTASHDEQKLKDVST